MLQICLQMLETGEERSEFEKLYYTYRNLMFYIANNILHDQHLAEDAVSETFIKLAERFDKILELGDINGKRTKAYVAASVKNTALNILKKEKHTISDEDIQIEFSNDRELDALEQIIEAESYESVQKEFNNLPDDFKQILQLSAIYEHDLKTISTELGISKETAKKRLYRARLMLKERLKNEQ